MEEKDKCLEKMLIRQVAISRPLSDKLIKDLENPRYSSGKLMKYGDIPLHILQISPVVESEVEIILDSKTCTAHYRPKKEATKGVKVTMVLLEQSEIDFYCKNYMYAGGNENSTHVIKKPE